MNMYILHPEVSGEEITLFFIQCIPLQTQLKVILAQ